VGGKPKKQSLLKIFLFPTVAGMVVGLSGMGFRTLSRVVETSLGCGFDFMFVVTLFALFAGPIRGKSLVVLYGAAGVVAGVTWWTLACPPWSVLIVAATGGALGITWAYTGGGYVEIKFR
jgi:hypothetical protein